MNEILLLHVPQFSNSNIDMPTKAKRQRIMLDLEAGKVTTRCIKDQLSGLGSVLADPDNRVSTVRTRDKKSKGSHYFHVVSCPLSHDPPRGWGCSVQGENHSTSHTTLPQVHGTTA